MPFGTKSGNWMRRFHLGGSFVLKLCRLQSFCLFQCLVIRNVPKFTSKPKMQPRLPIKAKKFDKGYSMFLKWQRDNKTYNEGWLGLIIRFWRGFPLWGRETGIKRLGSKEQASVSQGNQTPTFFLSPNLFSHQIMLRVCLLLSILVAGAPLSRAEEEDQEVQKLNRCSMVVPP